MTPDNIKILVQQGANMVLEERLIPQALKEIMALAKTSGAMITVMADHYTPSALAEALALGGKNLTINVKS